MKLLAELLTEAVKNYKVKLNAPTGLFKLSQYKQKLEDFLNGVDKKNVLSLKTYVTEKLGDSYVESFSVEAGKIVANIDATKNPSKSVTADLVKTLEAWVAEVDDTMSSEYGCSADAAFSFHMDSNRIFIDAKSVSKQGIDALDQLVEDLETVFPKKIGAYKSTTTNGVYELELDSNGLLSNLKDYAEIYAFCEMIVTECTPKNMTADNSRVSTTVFDGIRKKIEDFLTSAMMGVDARKANKSAIYNAIAYDEVPAEWNAALVEAGEDEAPNIRKFLSFYVELTEAQINFLFSHTGAA